MGGVQRSTLQGRFGRLNDLAGGGDPWSGLRKQFKLKLLYEEPLVAIGFCVAAEDQHAPIGSREVNVEHLDAARRLYRFATLVTGCLSSLMAENQDAGISGGTRIGAYEATHIRATVADHTTDLGADVVTTDRKLI
jgi:hypothetical protein